MNRAAARLACYLTMAAFLTLAFPAALPRAAALPRGQPMHMAGRSISSSPGSAVSSPPAIEFVDSFGGIIPTFAVTGTLAFLIHGNTLTVLDISAPAAPARIGRMPLALNADTLAVANGIVYVAGQGIVQIIDAHNPALPVETSRFQTRGDVNHIQVAGSLVYLTEGTEGVEVFDISDLSRPIRRAQYAQSEYLVCFLVVGSLAYVADTSNVLTILDISNPVAPIKRGTFTLSSPPQTHFWCVAVEGSRAYIGALTSGGWEDQPRLITLDITHPENPALLGNAELPAPLVTVAGNIAYTMSDSQLQLFDISDPGQPVARGTFSGTLLQVISEILQVAINRVYLVDSLATFKIIDASNPDHLTMLGSYATPPSLQYPNRLQIVGSTGYLLSGGFQSRPPQLQVLDLTNPISPTLRGYYAAPYAVDVYVFGTRAYLEEAVGPVELLDISNPDQPTLIARLNVDEMQAVDQANNRAYFLTSDQTGCTTPFCTLRHHKLTIFDVSNPNTPVREGTIQLFDSDGTEEGSVIVKGGFAYIAWEGALRIVDVHIPAAPVVRATYPLAQSRDLMQMVGNLAYVTSAARLTILDLTDPLKPVPLGQTGSLGGESSSVQIQGSLAYLSTSSGVRVIDISDPRRPIPRASYADVLGQVEALGDIIYVAGGIDGLHVLRLHPDRFPPPMFMPLARY